MTGGNLRAWKRRRHGRARQDPAPAPAGAPDAVRVRGADGPVPASCGCSASRSTRGTSCDPTASTSSRRAPRSTTSSTAIEQPSSSAGLLLGPGLQQLPAGHLDRPCSRCSSACSRRTPSRACSSAAAQVLMLVGPGGADAAHGGHDRAAVHPARARSASATSSSAASLAGVAFAVISGLLPFAIWNLKGYLDTIPKDLEEAAAVDGATPPPVVRQGRAAAGRAGARGHRVPGLRRRLDRVLLLGDLPAGDPNTYTLSVALNGMVGAFATHDAVGQVLRVRDPVRAARLGRLRCLPALDHRRARRGRGQG